ncbi:MAG: threonine synthase [Gemmataceae bacterium]|nr:threonine synthase [Gemmataceae bacterium]
MVDVAYDRERLRPPTSLRDFEARWAQRSDPLAFSGVWRFRELLPFAPPEAVVTIGEGQTLLQRADAVARYAGLEPGKLLLQYEGMNPSGSFKDNGMTAASTHARMVGATRAACASTGNTSASLAAYCSATGLMKPIVFIGSGKISYGKLSQALDHGALTLQIAGDFDDAMASVRQVARAAGIYLVNSVNPFRLEGQKTIMYRVLEALAWEPPDWIAVPGGNLGNVSAFGKAFAELRELGLLARVPRFAVVNAAGANTFSTLWNAGLRWNGGEFDQARIDSHHAEAGKAQTLASAIEINRPVNLPKALRALDWCGGVVTEATDEEILDAKAIIGAGGLGCEPASAASVAGVRKLRQTGTISPGERVVCILTGHQLKDPSATVGYHTGERKPFANKPVAVPNDLEAILAAIGATG